METTSQELLKLENKSFSSSLKESTLVICKEKDSVSKRKQPPPNGKPLTSSVPSSQDFLGVMSEANKKLQVEVKDNPERYDIEVLNGNESEIIEMDLMLGIADLHTPEAVAVAESAAASHHLLNPFHHPLAASIGEMDSEDTTDDDDGSKDGDDDCGTSQSGTPVKHRRSENGEEDSHGLIGRKW